MGLRLEVYNENYVGLVADFNFVENSKEFCTSNNVEEAMEYFDLYLDERTRSLKRNDPNQRIVDKLAINIENIEMFQKQLETITNTLTDEEANGFSLLFEEWSPSGVYKIGDRIRYNGVLYKCLTAHNAQQDWAPSAAPSLWAQILIDPAISGPQPWTQPSSTNPYMDGDRVTHNGKTWESQVDNNVWEPGTTGTESLWVEIAI